MTIAVLGLGAMGSRIAARVLDAGHDIVVWNRTEEKAKPFVDRGAALAESPADAAARADATIAMLTDPAALESVLADVPPDSTTLIQMSTVGPEAVSRLRFPRLLDAPVLGSLAEVEAGKLTIFVGGDEALVQEWTPLLSVLGRVLHVGAVGAGSAAKLVANTALVGVITLLGESIAFGEGLGLPRDVVFEILATTPLSQQAERRRAAIESGDYPPRFALSLARKDADLILEAAERAGVGLRLVREARRWFVDAEAAGHGADDYAAVLAEIVEAAEGGQAS
jgi:3-hydroxyisobutyrate dehydrogenase-like beta-hydroxyacid dehydrogenase